MNKRSPLIITLVCALAFIGPSCISELRAQDKYSVGFFASVPTGNYKSKNLGDGSFAKPGWGLSFDDMVRMDSWPKGLSLGIHLSYQVNDLDNVALQESYSDALGSRTEVGESSYKPLIVTGGPFFEIPVSDIFAIELKTGIGVVFTNIDPFVINVYDNQGVKLFGDVIGFEGKPNFSYLLGLQFEILLSDQMKIGLFGDFSSAREQVIATVGNIATVNSDFDLSFLNTGINMSLRLK